MKKITLALAAIAMIAFAGCKKENVTVTENGMTTINLSTEAYGYGDKMAYNAYDQYVMFQTGDHLYCNGYDATLILRDPATMEAYNLADGDQNSNFASFVIPTENVDETMTILYPTTSFVAGDIADFPAWNCPMPSTVQWIMEDVSAAPATINAAVTSNWPMAIQKENFRGNYQLRNCVAVVSPQVVVGTAFLQNLTGYTYDENAEITINQIRLTSTTNMLTGNGHIDFTDPNAPVLVMDGTVPADGDVLTINPNLNYHETYYADGGIIHVLGNATLAPMHVGDNIKMDVDFTITNSNGVEYSCTYNGNTVTLDEDVESGRSILRSYRTRMQINLYNRNGAAKVTITNVYDPNAK